MVKGNFDKQVLTRFVQTECKRQLFLDLSQTRPKGPNHVSFFPGYTCLQSNGTPKNVKI